MRYVIVSSNVLYNDFPDRLKEVYNDFEFVLINKKEDLTFDNLKRIDPNYIFFPHWSHLIPENIFINFQCVIFHMTDVPFGRGGSPLQNLIARGIYETKITALKCEMGIDSGPVYMKMPLSLYGTAEEIFLRAKPIIEKMIIHIIENEPSPLPQDGESVFFPRRKPGESNMENLTEIEQVYDYIRMLDATGYPKAYFETKHMRLEFERVSLKDGHLVADVKIVKKEYQNE